MFHVFRWMKRFKQTRCHIMVEGRCFDLSRRAWCWWKMRCTSSLGLVSWCLTHLQRQILEKCRAYCWTSIGGFHKGQGYCLSAEAVAKSCGGVWTSVAKQQVGLDLWRGAEEPVYVYLAAVKGSRLRESFGSWGHQFVSIYTDMSGARGEIGDLEAGWNSCAVMWCSGR